MKIPLLEQIEESERHRNNLQALRDDGFEYPEGPSLETRLNRAEGIVLTLEFLKTYETDFRQFMRQR